MDNQIDAEQHPRVRSAYETVAAEHGPEIAAEVAKRLAWVISESSPSLDRYLDDLPDYFTRSALWQREMDAWKAANGYGAKGSPALSEVRKRRREASTQAGGTARGEANPRSRLCDNDVRAIRRRREAGETSLALAAEFGLTKRNINLIVSRQRWAHVAD